MRVGTDVWAGNEMLAVADHTGHLDPSLVRRVEFSNNQEVLRALRNGIIEAGALMLDETMLAVDDGGDLVVLAALDSSIGSDAVLTREPIGSIEGLRGKRVGVQLNSGSLQMLRRGLASSNMTPADVIVVNLPPDRHESSFLSGQVDAVVTYDPMRIALLNHGAVDLYNSSAIAGDVVNLLVVSRRYLETHPVHCRALLDAWWAGRDAFTRTPDARAWSAGRLGLSPADLERAFTTIELFDAAKSRHLLDGPAAALPATAWRFHGFMRENGRLRRDQPVDDLFRLPAGWTR
jgi:NitT/TauT family transport system substrate-binding protein